MTDKFTLIHAEKATHTVELMTRLLHVSRAGYYSWVKRGDTPSPAATDWYETVKLAYGFDFVSGRTDFDPVPATWLEMDRILSYWQGKGVDGFRVDFAHFVPNAAWRFS